MLFFFVSLLVGLSMCQFSGTTNDCNSVDKCPTVHILFVIDTSASMNDDAVGLCNVLENTITDVEQSLSVNVVSDVVGMTRWGINTPGGRYPCPAPPAAGPYISVCANFTGDFRTICETTCNDRAVNSDQEFPWFPCLTTDLMRVWRDKVPEVWTYSGNDLYGISGYGEPTQLGWDWSNSSITPGTSSCIWPQPRLCLNESGGVCGGWGSTNTVSNGARLDNPSGSWNIQGDTEGWGSAGIIAAKYYDWTPNSLKIIVPVIDEGPCMGGDAVCAPGTSNDRWTFHTKPASLDCVNSVHDDDITNLFTQIAVEEDVVVSTIIARAVTHALYEPISNYAQQVANATGGLVTDTADDCADCANSIKTIIVDACNKYVWSCDDRDPCTIRETCQFPDLTVNGSVGNVTDIPCIGICICENNCEEVSSFSVPEDDIDVVGGGDGTDEATYIGAGVGAGVVGLLLLCALAGIFLIGIAILAVIAIVVALLQATGVVSSSAEVMANAFVDGGATFNPTYEGQSMETQNPLFE